MLILSHLLIFSSSHQLIQYNQLANSAVFNNIVTLTILTVSVTIGIETDAEDGVEYLDTLQLINEVPTVPYSKIYKCLKT